MGAPPAFLAALWQGGSPRFVTDEGLQWHYRSGNRQEGHDEP